MLDVCGDLHCDCEEQRINSVNVISENNGIYFHLPQEAQGWGLFYKLKELELQVYGRNEFGEFIGIKNRDEAQRFLLGNSKFDDLRGYDIVFKIISKLGLEKEKFIFMSNSEQKFYTLKKEGE